MPNYDYFLKGNPNDVLLQCIEIRHSTIRPQRYVSNKADGFQTAILEKVYDASSQTTIDKPITFQYAPLEIKVGEVTESLNQSLQITIGDLGDFYKILQQIDVISEYNESYNEKPTVVYTEWLASDNSKPTLTIPNLEITEIKTKNNNSAFTCAVKKIDGRKTGVTYNLKDFPTLRGLT